MARDTDNPYNFLLASLTSHTTQKPRQRTAYNLWCKLYGQEVEEETAEDGRSRRGVGKAETRQTPEHAEQPLQRPSGGGKEGMDEEE